MNPTPDAASSAATPTFAAPTSGPRRKRMMERPAPAPIVATGTPTFGDGYRRAETLTRRPLDLETPADLGRPTPYLDAAGEEIARAELAEIRHRPWHTCQTALNAMRGEASGRFLPLRRGATGIFEIPMLGQPGGPVDEAELAMMVRRAGEIAGYALLLVDGRGARILLARNSRIYKDAPGDVQDLSRTLLNLIRSLDGHSAIAGAAGRLIDHPTLCATCSPCLLEMGRVADREVSRLRRQVELTRAELLAAIERFEGTGAAEREAGHAAAGREKIARTGVDR